MLAPTLLVGLLKFLAPSFPRVLMFMVFLHSEPPLVLLMLKLLPEAYEVAFTRS